MIYELDGVAPECADDSVWVAPNAAVIGNVILKANASVWFGVTIRGDNDPITIGEGSNIQDNSVLHADLGAPCVVGKGVTVGHKVMLHGCTIGDHTLIGMGSTILNHAKIGAGSIVGANSLITEGKEFPEGVLIVGAPARVVRKLKPEEQEMIKMSERIYTDNAARFAKGLKEVRID
ncbi:gamma carbonic anhydrase family protein [Kordiimonas lacus]|uniref:Carbonic anhydrase or acetyltransferase, isoleucine patch superfamily n=1 Tax=Kordiimonas lacus TaxID=637679 RepID=A0A1G7CEC6_9PROT|nr:gamma carbonic anhydrase family protein [Kordiimonas lacus]SDE37687.1 Carbonic anhydrase or acetyltransferase, isoleucine patch superfamily [Kordiimonas lacus]